MNKHLITGAAVCALVVATSGAAAADSRSRAFEPIDGSAYGQQSDDWDVPLIAPEGYEQRLVADETVLDIYGGGTDDLTDMNTVNESGPRAGRYLIRTHEVSSNGAVSVVDLKTGEARVVAQDPGFRRVDGIEWTPWGTILFGEETAGGRVFEADFDATRPFAPLSWEERREIGVQRHEGIAATEDAVYVVDELNGGSIYRFVPKRAGDLSDGQLYALKLTGLEDAEQKWDQAAYETKVGEYEWVALDMTQAVVDADVASNAVNATEFGRPEDVEVIDGVLYVANTSENRVVAIQLGDEEDDDQAHRRGHRKGHRETRESHDDRREEGHRKGEDGDEDGAQTQRLTTFVHAGDNVPVEDSAAGITGFANPDNLAQGPDGRLWIVEDNSPSDIWVAGKDRDEDGTADRVDLFASLRDSGAEVSGIYFGTDPRTLYFNVQHPAKPLADGTWKIARR